MGVCNCMSRNKYPKFENKKDIRENERNKQRYVAMSEINKSKSIDYIAWPHKKVNFYFKIKKLIKYCLL
jgi:hypothetical protein